MILKFIELALSDIKLSLKLLHPRRIKNAIHFLFFDNGNLSQLYRRYQSIYNDEKVENAERTSNKILCSTGKRDIFIFPIIDWDFRYQRPQHIASNLAKRGFRVFYFSTVPLIAPNQKNYLLSETAVNLVYLCKLHAPSGLNDNLHWDEMSKQTYNEYVAAARAMMLDFGIFDPILILNHFYWTPLCKNLPRSALIYDCMDHHVAFFDAACTDMPKTEIELIKECSLIITSSVYLHEKIGAVRNNTLIRNGCDSAFFSAVPPTKHSNSHQPVVGYIGAIAEWFDNALLADVARSLPSWRFVLVGALVGGDISELRSLSNVEFVGEIEYSHLPLYLAEFDVCIIPFKLTELTKATNPVKVYEYLSAGRPVVSTPLPELLLLNGLVDVAETPENFADQLKRALLKSKDPEFTCNLKKWAEQQDWIVRTDLLISLIQER